MAIKTAAEAEVYYKRVGMLRYGALRSHPQMFIALAHHADAGRLTAKQLRELGLVLKAIMIGTDAQRAELRGRFFRRLNEAHGRMADPRAAFEYLLQNTRALGSTGDVEADWWAGGARHDRAVSLGAAAEAGGRRREETVMFDLAALERREEDEAAGRPPEMDVDEFEKFVKRGLIGRIPLQIARGYNALVAALKEAEPRSPVMRVLKPRFARVAQLLSRDKNTVIHASNSAVAPKHVSIAFNPTEKRLAVQDFYRAGAGINGTLLLPGKTPRVPFVIVRRGGNESVATTAKGHMLKSAIALLSQGHAFELGDNIFLIQKLGARAVRLTGIAGPVKGRVFKFNPEKSREVTIGREVDNHIRLLDRPIVKQARK